MSKFKVSIVRDDGAEVLLQPGGQAEHDFVKDVVDRVATKGLGMFSSEAKIKSAIKTSIEEAFANIKREVRPA